MISTKSKDMFRTPLHLFQRYDKIHSFTLDAAANENDHLCPQWFGPGGIVDDIKWTGEDQWRGQRVWCNPPYSMIPEFLDIFAGPGLTASVIVALLPAWTDRDWFHHHIMWRYGGTELEFLKGRVQFLNQDGTKPKWGPTFGSMVVTF